MERIKFGTDGWRGILAHQFTVDNVARITHATALWLLNKHESPEVIIGYDTRFLGKMFAELAARVLAAKGIPVRISDDFVTTPMVSLAVRDWRADLGIMITASHNERSYNGYKLKGSHGGPLMTEDLKNIEDLISMDLALDLDQMKWEQFITRELIRYADLEAHYLSVVTSGFDLNEVRPLGHRILFDAMYGSAQHIFPRIISDANLQHCTVDPNFGGITPEPLESNLEDSIALIKKVKKLELGIALDGDGDRIALISHKGNYIDPHRILLLLIQILAGYKKHRGIVVTGYSSTHKVEVLAAHYNLDVVRVPVGFMEICRRIQHEDVLIGGEESGGISIRGHLPERDGIWIALTILQFISESGKSLVEILSEIESLTGPFTCTRRDIPFTREKRSRILDACSRGFDTFGDRKVIRHEFLDGFKFYLSKDEWVLVRASGTEPLLRIYAEAPGPEQAENIIDKVQKSLQQIVV